GRMVCEGIEKQFLGGANRRYTVYLSGERADIAIMLTLINNRYYHYVAALDPFCLFVY
ncbi:MAG: hypothetical protein RIS73_2002, partial [Bacteroidota bacterium]